MRDSVLGQRGVTFLAPELGTCIGADHATVIDFYGLDVHAQQLATAVTTVEDWPGRPHRPVQLRFRRRGEQVLKWVSEKTFYLASDQAFWPLS